MQRETTRIRIDLLLYTLFFLSGASALVYEVLWIRMLALVLGGNSYGIATVLSAFMAGLALGAWAFGRRADRLQRPLVAYALMEAAIGLYAAVVPTLFALTQPVYGWIWETFNPAFQPFLLVRFAATFLILVVPTTLMGATLPVLARYVARSAERASSDIGTLYAVNTAGATVGTLLVGFVLLPAIGVNNTLTVAVSMNFAVAVLAVGLYLARSSTPSAPAAPIPEVRSEEPARGAKARISIGRIHWAYAASGAAALAYEVTWTRLLASTVGSTTYAFAAMLGTFLVGLAFGAWWQSRRMDGVGSPERTFGRRQLQIAAAAIVSWIALLLIPILLLLTAGFLPAVPGGAQTVAVLAAVAVMFLPAFLLGTIFPVVVKIACRELADLGEQLGKIYSFNTLGAIVGSFVTGFVLLPSIGTHQAIAVAIGLNLFLAAWFSGRSLRRLTRFAVNGALAALMFFVLAPLFSPLSAQLAGAIYAVPLQNLQGGSVASQDLPTTRLSYHRDGIETSVSVFTVLDGEGQARGYTLRLNGRANASAFDPEVSDWRGTDMPTQILLSQLPLLLGPRSPEAVDAFIIGYGSGISVGTLLPHPVRSVRVAEIEPAVLEAAQYFSAFNRRPETDPRVQILLADARNNLLHSSAMYSLIVSEPSQPWMPGSSALFTEEFFRIVGSRLEPGGVFCQWIETYDLAPEDLRSILAAFRLVFPTVYVFSPRAESADLLIVGSGQMLQLDQRRVESRLVHPTVREEMARIGVGSFEDLAAKLLVGPRGVERLVAGATPNTDDNARVEFSSPRFLLTPMNEANIAMLSQYRERADSYLAD